MSRINVPVLIVGMSGSGKSSTFRELPADKTVIVNTERKPMPFKGFSKFKNINISKYKDYTKLMKELKEAGDKYDYVVIDSLTSLLEMCNKYCETVYSGFNIWSEYNSMVYNVLQDIKDLPQQVFVVGIPEFIEIAPGEIKAVVKTKGKEFKASIEKEFAIVLHTHLNDDEEGNITEYLLDTKPSKSTSAKSPNGMYEQRYIPNDATVIDKAINEYYT
jgi:hypothetical protein